MLRRLHDCRRAAAGTPGDPRRRAVTRRLIVVAMVGWSVLAATGCRRASYAADDRARTHVGIVFDIGGKDDRSFNAAAWAGVKCAESGTLPDGRPCGKPVSYTHLTLPTSDLV